MSAHERIVLWAVLSARSTRRRELREVIPGERQMTQRQWEAAKRSLTDKGLLTKAGRVTPAGQTALEK